MPATVRQKDRQTDRQVYLRDRLIFRFLDLKQNVTVAKHTDFTAIAHNNKSV